MNLRDLKSLNSIISEVTEPETQDKSRMIQEGFGNSLSAKARQVVDEQVEGSRGPNPQGKPVKVKPATGSVGIEADRIKRDGQAEVDRMARKALKRAKKKAATNEEVELAEKAAPGYEDWASDPKVKASFKKQYGKDWKQVMYGRSWNMKEATNEEAELDLAEGVNAKRLRVLRKHVKDGANPMSPEVKDFMARSFKKTTNANKTRIAPGGSAVKAMEVRMRKKHSAMKEKGLAESDQLDEGKGGRSNFTNLMKSQVSRVGRAGGREDVQREIGNHTEGEASDGVKMSIKARRAFRDANIDARDKERVARKTKAAMKEQVLSEAGYKRLMRIKKAAYKADLDSRGSSPSDPILTGPFGRRYKQEKKHSRLTRAAAELTTKVAANMARRGGASADAVRGSGSLMGKRGTFSQKAIKLANQRDKGLAKFRGKAAEGKRWASSYPTADKRASQQRYAKFDNQSRSGDFGQNNQAAMRSTYNYLKRTGKISEELAGLIEAAPKKALPKPKKKPIVKKPIVDFADSSKYDKWKSRLSPAAAKAEEKRIAKRTEKAHALLASRGGFDGGHGPSPGSRWI